MRSAFSDKYKGITAFIAHVDKHLHNEQNRSICIEIG